MRQQLGTAWVDYYYNNTMTRQLLLLLVLAFGRPANLYPAFPLLVFLPIRLPYPLVLRLQLGENLLRLVEYPVGGCATGVALGRLDEPFGGTTVFISSCREP